MQPSRKGIALLILALFTAVTLGSVPLSAHHGWRWAENENSEISGTIKSTKLGNPHGLVYLDVNGEEWTVEVGQPWRNDKAGLKDNLLAVDVKVTVQGHRSLDKAQKVFKAERVIIEGKTFDLYPERD